MRDGRGGRLENLMGDAPRLLFILARNDPDARARFHGQLLARRAPQPLNSNRSKIPDGSGTNRPAAAAMPGR